MRTVYRWHMISLYCPENLLYRERVESYKQMWAAGASEQELQSACKRIVHDFCTTESVMEVNMDERTRNKLMQLSEEAPSPTMFDQSLVTVDRDIARSLQAFYVSDAFLTYYDNRNLVNSLVESSPPIVPSGSQSSRGRSHTIGADEESREEILIKVRRAFNVSNKVCLKRHFDITSSFTYKVHESTADGPHLGYGVQRGSVFFFYNLQEEQVLKVLSAALLGKTTTAEADHAAQSELEESSMHDEIDADDDVAASGCCGGGSGPRKRSSSAPPPMKSQRMSAQAAPEWFVKDASGKVHGPIKQISVQLLFRYHVLPLSAQAAPGQAENFKQLAAYPDLFSPSRMIETLDPTAMPSF